MRTKTLTVALCIPLLAALAAAEPVDEVKAEVPELFAFHDVIMPLWHDAWPNKDTAQMKELLPRVEEHVAAVSAAELPGILRDKQERWDEGVAALQDDVEAYRTAAAADDTQALLDAVESLHAHFEGLVRTVRPVMKELDAYHQVLYVVYHHYAPGRQTDELRSAAAQLVDRCSELEAATVPARFQSRSDDLRGAFADLCAATAVFRAAVDSGDPAAVDGALEPMHSRYQAAEALFD